MSKNFLFVHFIGDFQNGEQVYFSVSKDGLHWKELNDAKPVLTSTEGDKGVRDPFIVKHPKTDVYYLFGTDLSMYHRNHDWGQAVINGSRDIIVWESTDLVHWSEPRFCTVGLPEAGCVWAPEAIYDEEEEAFLVFWASNIKEENDTEARHRIYASYTNDFKEFTSPEKYIERDQSVIDTTIIYTDDHYYRFTKDEQTKKIILDKGRELKGDFQAIRSETLSKAEGLEGPQVYPLDENRWILIVDQFAKGLGYVPYEIKDFNTGDIQLLDQDAFDFGNTRKRHGGVIPISEDEYSRLTAHFGVAD
ncbi:hypothetical protein GCM10008932_06920 [Alkalibacterium iburiense]|uniref:1,4-beta-xylanase n=1 Tax=Alkalibacterium iburiense TaxID=290589 RepID=A0ABP3GZK6_9LACT